MSLDPGFDVLHRTKAPLSEYFPVVRRCGDGGGDFCGMRDMRCENGKQRQVSFRFVSSQSQSISLSLSRLIDLGDYMCVVIELPGSKSRVANMSIIIDERERERDGENDDVEMTR